MLPALNTVFIVVGLSVFEVYLDNPGILEDVRRALSGESFSAVRETTGRTFETWYSPLPAENGGLAGTIGVAVDITDRRRAEDERVMAAGLKRAASSQAAMSPCSVMQSCASGAAAAPSSGACAMEATAPWCARR